MKIIITIVIVFILGGLSAVFIAMQNTSDQTTISKPFDPTVAHDPEPETGPRSTVMPSGWEDIPTDQVVSPAGTGLQGEEKPELEEKEKYYSAINLPDINGYIMHAGNGFSVTAEGLVDGLSVTPKVVSKDNSTSFDLKPSIVKNGKLIVSIPTNLSNGGYFLELTVNGKAYKVMFDIIPNGTQHIENSYE